MTSSYLNIHPDLHDYITREVFPQYHQNESGHGLPHIKYVIERALRLAATLNKVDTSIVYTAAAYHDIGHHLDPQHHELVSAQIAACDQFLRQFFSSEQLTIIIEAIEDHRASCGHEPRNIYGKIISTADRNTNINDCLRRSYSYGRHLYPELTPEQLYERAYKHLLAKFGPDGYAPSYFPDQQYTEFLQAIRSLLADKENFLQVQRRYITSLQKQGKIN